MKSNQIGCLTTSGLVAIVFTLVLVGAAFMLSGGRLFSPGDLLAKVGQPLGGVASHAELNNQCPACHTAPWSHTSMADRCLICHADITVQLTQSNSLHGLLLGKDKPLTCRPCHTEHKGANANITHLEMKDFPHELLGYSLKAHQKLSNGKPFACQDCHPQTVTKFDVTICMTCHTNISADFMQRHTAAYGDYCLACHDGVDIYGKKFNHNQASFKITGKHVALDCGQCHTGARTPADLKASPTTCFACHQKDDQHNGDLGQACASCHVTEAWNQIHFDHSKSKFPLTGAHIKVDCAKCHINKVLIGTPTNCYGCHQRDDQHDGELGQFCDTCHITDAWNKIHFDHSKAKFPLTGAHLLIDCVKCHADNVYKTTPTNCYACHAKDDNHKGELGQDCVTCHDTDAWRNVHFDHSQAIFPLTGAHLQVDCDQCHINNVYKATPTNCYACHAKDDHHNGAFGQDCAACHTTDAWSNVHFDHSTTNFPLTGAHLSVACTQCHINNVYQGTPTNCYACHQKDDHHNGAFGQDCAACHTTDAWSNVHFDHSKSNFPLTGAHQQVACTLCHINNVYQGTPTNCYACHQKDDHHNGAFGQDCAACHTTDAWSNVHFDHSKSNFPLTGAHQQVACTLCHINNVYQGTPTNCYACHQKDDHHNGAFGQDCAACHITAAWNQVTFDHSKTNFPLTGAHANLPCQQCHANGYQGTPTACNACHAEPPYHQGLFGVDCASCHNTNAWTPATYNGPHTFPLGHGGAGGNCRSCHPAGLGAYTCYTCHDQARMRQQHPGVSNLDQCATCHPTGRNEGGGGG